MEFEPELLTSQRWMGLWRGLNGEPFIAHPTHAIRGVMMLPIDADGNILFVREPCVYDGKPILSLPAGGVDTGEDPLDAANRELQEEIGYKGNQLHLLATLNPLARHANWIVYGVLATDLLPSQLPNPDAYDLIPTITKVPFANFRGLIERGEIRDSNIISMLYLAEDKFKQQ